MMKEITENLNLRSNTSNPAFKDIPAQGTEKSNMKDIEATNFYGLMKNVTDQDMVKIQVYNKR